MRGLEAVLRLDVPLIKFNENYSSINRSCMFDNLPETVIDKQTLLLIQIYDLYKAVDHSTTATGSATLFRSLIQPPTSLELILAKQEAVQELQSDDRLRNAVAEYLGVFQNGENILFYFINNQIDSFSPYWHFKAARSAGRRIFEAVQNIPNPESEYLQCLVNDIKAFEDSQVYRLMRGPIYRTIRDIKSKEDIGFFTPAFRFISSRLGFGTLILIGVGIDSLLLKGQDPVVSAIGPMSLMYGLLYGLMMKPMTDHDTIIQPLRKKTVNDKSFVLAVDSVGRLDELMSFIAFSKAMPHDTMLPTITDGEYHYFVAENLRNPILAKDDPNYIPNHVNLDGARLTFITGPNSGGKTTYSKSIFQNQLLGQIGGYVVASKASMNVADRMAYQYYVPDVLQSEEGDFGENLKRTKNIFLRISPRSLVIMNTLASGTTSEEEMYVSTYILNGFYDIGNNTILVTHKHELVSRFMDMGRGQFLQFEFDRDPTFRWDYGISKTSHAGRVAKKIGFSEEDIEAHLLRKGYLKP